MNSLNLERVDIHPLSHYARYWTGEKVSLVKIDVEAMELQLLEGMDNLLIYHRPMLYVEDSTPRVRGQKGESEVVKSTSSRKLVKNSDSPIDSENLNPDQSDQANFSQEVLKESQSEKTQNKENVHRATGWRLVLNLIILF